MLNLIATLPLLTGLAPGPVTGPASGSPPGPHGARVDEDAYEELLAGYESALDDWKDLYREAEGMQARKELKARHPARAYWPRFEALAAADEGRALLWMVDSLRDKGLKVSDVRAEKARLYGVLAQEYLDAPWFGDVLERLPGERRSLAEGQEESTYRAAIARSPHRAVQAHAMYRLSEKLHKNLGELPQQESERLMETLAADYADTPHGEDAAGILFERRHLTVGTIAPDFEGETIDGHAFKLSDYRGKIVLLDFYGFW